MPAQVVTIDGRGLVMIQAERGGGCLVNAPMSFRPTKRDESEVVSELSEDSPGAVVPEKDQSEKAELVRCLQQFNISYIDEEKGGSRAT
jgi:hypothetical protein